MKTISIPDEMYQRLEARQKGEQTVVDVIGILLDQTDILYIRQEYEGKIEQLKETWKKQKKIALTKSFAITQGKVFEHLVPFMPDWKYAPSDARFIGSPIDYLVFDGLKEGNPRRLVIVEVKTGEKLKPRLAKAQESIQAIVEQKEIYWETLKI